MQKGFTLIELLIVVAIIAILAAIAIPNFLEAQTRAKVSRSKADIKAMVTAVESYAVDNNSYLSGSAYTDMENPNSFPAPDLLSALTTPVAYMSSLPPTAPFGSFRGYGNNEKSYNYLGGTYWNNSKALWTPSFFPV